MSITRTLLATLLLTGTVPLVAAPQAPAEAALGRVRVSHAVVADGKPLAAAAYDIRLTGEEPAHRVGMSAHAERWVEFLSRGVVVGREVATVISDRDMLTVANGPLRRVNTSRTELLKGGDYLRVWISRGGQHYLINMPLANARAPRRSAAAPAR